MSFPRNTLAEIEEAIAAAVTALQATDYAQGRTNAAWSHSLQPFSTEGNADRLHLEFAVFTSLVENTDMEEGGVGGYVRVRCRTDVVFSYQLRFDAQVADQRLAMNAANDVVRAVNKLQDGVDVVPRIIWEPSVSDDGTWLLIRTQFDVLTELGV